MRSLTSIYNPEFFIDGPKHLGESGYQYDLTIKINRNKEAPNFAIGQAQDDNCRRNLGSSLEKLGWISSANIEFKPREKFKISNLDFSKFNGIYQREPHIRIIHDTINSYIASGTKKRSHTLLWGEPASCKTTLFERFKILYDDDIERVYFIDGPTLTKAGFENWLIDKSQSDSLPEIIVIEEIEKQPLNNLNCLLSVMQSGYISKTNAKIGSVKEEIKSLIWATSNDIDSLKKFRNGALLSRFTHCIYCKKPDKSLIELILKNEVIRLNGNQSWVDKVMELCYNEIPKVTKQPFSNDIRTVLGHLDGRDRLIDGSYQKDVIEILKGQYENN